MSTVSDRPRSGNAAATGDVRRGRSLPTQRASADQPEIETGLSLTAIAAAQRGDEDAFRGIFRAVQPLLLRYLRVLVGDDADDVASETWLQIARDLRTFRGDEDGFRGWAATIARHRAMDHLRRLRRRLSTPMPAEELNDLVDDGDPAMLALDAVGTQAAIRLIGTLPRDQAEAVLLRVLMGLDAASVGRVLGKRPGAVRVAAHRGLRRLAQRLREAETTRSELRTASAAAEVTPAEAPSLRDTR
jgi:RNA polymerase sigma-70 factor (ECF subfamily)